METILLAITIGALLVAFVMSAVVWRVSREERARSAARVAALAAAASQSEATVVVRQARAVDATPAAAALPLHVDSEPESTADEPRWGSSRISAFTPARAAAPQPRVPDLALNSAAHELPTRPATAPIADTFLGGEERRDSQGGQRGLAVAAAVLAIVLAGAGYWLISGGRAAVGEATTAATAAPLELMSLRHDRVGGRLSLSGLVRNPSAGAAVENLSAVVFLFDAQGAFITSARSAVDFRRLAPGDESPFVITIDAPANIARYRVSFRTEAGVLAHVDRRSEQPATTAIAGTKS